MQTISNIAQLRSVTGSWRRRGERVAFVPTMGNLHKGHLSLVEHARGEADRVVASVFVNPLQFAPGEDFDSYPRTFARDQQALEQADADVMFAPDVKEIYPEGQEPATRVEVQALSDILCGAHRSGFFVGVATVVAKLFHLVQPDVAVFGKKDYQQLVIVRRMVGDLHWPIRIVGVETMRESDGLAMSSRNRYLTDSERKVAPHLYEVLSSIANRLREDGQYDNGQLEQATRDELAKTGFRLDYLGVRRCSDLALPETTDRQLVVLAAAWLGAARLIDNIEISVS